MNRYLIVICIVAMVIWVPSVNARPLSIVCGTPGIGAQICQKAVKRWSDKQQIPVQTLIAPKDPSQLLELYTTIFTNELDLVDVVLVDSRWLGVLQQYFLPLKSLNKLDFLPTTIEQFTVDQQSMAIPWFLDAAVMYYRKDWLPENQQDLAISAESLFAQALRVITSQELLTGASLYGFVWSGRSDSVLPSNMSQWLTTKESEGKPTWVGIDLVKQIKEQIGITIPELVFATDQRQAYELYVQGQAIFLQSIASQWFVLSQTKLGAKTGLMLPIYSAQQPHSVITTQGLAVVKSSRYAEQAISLIQFLTGAEEQKNRLYEGNFFPTRLTLYTNKSLQQEFPMLALLGSAIPYMVGGLGQSIQQHYFQVSEQLQQIMQGLLTGSVDFDEGLQKLNELLYE